MPNMPTFQVTDAQAQRILAAYGDADAYRAWLKRAIREHVIAHEGRVLDDQHNAEKRKRQKEAADALPAD
jgi:hypothetical protein